MSEIRLEDRCAITAPAVPIVICPCRATPSLRCRAIDGWTSPQVAIAINVGYYRSTRCWWGAKNASRLSSRTVSTSWTAVWRVPCDVRTPSPIYGPKLIQTVAIDSAYVSQSATGALHTSRCVTLSVWWIWYGMVGIVTDSTCNREVDLVADEYQY